MFGLGQKQRRKRVTAKTAKLDFDVQSDLPRSMLGRRVQLHGRQPSMDVDGSRAYSGTPSGWKNPRVFWEDELRIG